MPLSLSGQITKKIYLDTPIVKHDPTQKIAEFTVSDRGKLVALGTSRRIAWIYDNFLCKAKGNQG